MRVYRGKHSRRSGFRKHKCWRPLNLLITPLPRAAAVLCQRLHAFPSFEPYATKHHQSSSGQHGPIIMRGSATSEGAQRQLQRASKFLAKILPKIIRYGYGLSRSVALHLIFLSREAERNGMIVVRLAAAGCSLLRNPDDLSAILLT